jgi:hypothetical protein
MINESTLTQLIYCVRSEKLRVQLISELKQSFTFAVSKEPKKEAEEVKEPLAEE